MKRVLLYCDACGSEGPRGKSAASARLSARPRGWRAINGKDVCGECRARFKVRWDGVILEKVSA